MFSGIVQKKGKLVRKRQEGRHLRLTFEASSWEKPLKRGESISVNGVCLTIAQKPTRNRFAVQAVHKTLDQTTLSSLRLQESVNLERSLKWGERIGGHFVLGHVDGVGRVVRRRGDGKSFSLQIEAPSSMVDFLVPKGSVAVDGVSFTVQRMAGSLITVAVIDHTRRVTTIGRKKRGDLVNLEADVIAKHLARLIQSTSSGST